MKKQRGFSLIELMIGLAILAVIGAIATGSYNGVGSQAQSLLTSMQELGTGAERFKMDVGCYPSTLSQLVKQGGTAGTLTTTGTWCGTIDSTKQWKGPYVQPLQLETDQKISLEQISEGTTVTIAKYSSAVAAAPTTQATNPAGAAPVALIHATNLGLLPGRTHSWFVVAEKVPYEVGLEIMSRCNGSKEDNSIPGSSAATLPLNKCSLGADATAAAAADNTPITVFYNFAQTRAA